MKKLSILMTGALLAVLILQGCSKDAETSAPVQDQSTVTPPKDVAPVIARNDMIPLGVFSIATGAAGHSAIQSALLGGSVQPLVNRIPDPLNALDSVYRQPDRSWGVSFNDVIVVGQGIVTATGAACPVTGACACTLVGGATNCRGDNGVPVVGAMNATIQITNDTMSGGIGSCAMYANSICKTNYDCYPNQTGAALAFECTFPASLVGANLLFEGGAPNGDDGPLCGPDGICGVPYDADDPVDWNGANDISGDADDPNPGADCTTPNAGAASTANAAACFAGTACTEVNEVDVTVPLSTTGGQQRYCLGKQIVDNGQIDSLGYCLNGFTPCGDNNISGDRIAAAGFVKGTIFTACGAGTCGAGDVANTPCLVAADCPVSGICAGAAPIGTLTNAATCWTGCGLEAGVAPAITVGAPTCTPGRDLHCVQVQYDGSQAPGFTSLNGVTYPKCTAGVYTPQGYDNAPANDAWLVGEILQGASGVQTLAITPYEADYCVHRFSIHELASGDSIGCTATCGDGWVAANAVPAEVCEPVDDGSNQNRDLGCTTKYCSNDVVLPYTPCLINADCGGAPAVCGARCDGVTCGACAPPVVTCGNGVNDAGEDCDPTGPNALLDQCCNPTTCEFVNAGATDPQGECDATATDCDAPDVCDAVGQCVPTVDPNGTNCGAAPTTCDTQDTCDGVGTACPASYALAGTACGSALTEPTCNPDACNAVGVCLDNANAADLTTPCASNPVVVGEDTCCAGLCVVGPGGPGTCAAGGAVVTVITPFKGTSGSAPFANTYNDPVTGDYNTGQVSGSGAASDFYTITPNDPLVTNHGSDRIFVQVTFNQALAAEVVACDVNGLPMDESDCIAGDTTCIVHGVHPEVTGSGIDTTMQADDAVAPIDLTGVFPDEADTSTAVTVTCTTDALNPALLNGTLRLGFVGVQDQVLAAAGGTRDIHVFVYCADGATQDCNDLAAGGGADKGINYQGVWLHYNPAIITALNGLVATPNRANPATAYGIGANVAGPNACVAGPAGTSLFRGRAPNFGGWAMADMGGCNFSYSLQPAGTISYIDATAISTDNFEYIGGRNALPLRGYTPGGPVPSSNVTGILIYQ